MIFKIRKLMLNFLKIEVFFEKLILNIFENKSLASTQIIIPIINIDNINIYSWLKLIKKNINNKIIEVINLFNKFCDIKYYQSFS